jgi:hypothetical protein
MRMRERSWASALAAGASAILSAAGAGAYSFGPPNARTGAPGESTCNSASCHNSFALNSGTGRVAIDAPLTYARGHTYTIFVDVEHPDRIRWGFELTALGPSNQRAGTLAAIDANAQVSSVAGGRQYIKHTSVGTALGQLEGNTWIFTWRAPDPEIGDVRFFAAGNAANGNGTQLGDSIYTTVATVPEPGARAAPIAALLVVSGLRLAARGAPRQRAPRRAAPHRAGPAAGATQLPGSRPGRADSSRAGPPPGR